MMKGICLSSVLLLCLAVAVFTTTVDDERFPLNSDHDHDFVDDKGKSSLPQFKKDVDDMVLARPHNAEAESEQQSKPMDNLNPGDVILGDIRPTEEQKKFMEEDGHHDNGGRTKRNFIRITQYQWPDATLPYEIDIQLESSRTVIEETMQYISNRSCINFLQYDDSVSSAGQTYRVVFRNSASSSCSSYLGRIPLTYQPQTIHLPEGCRNFGEIYRQIYHALGFYNEEQRTDRDNYIRVELSNVLDGRLQNLDRANGDTFGIPYDYSSIMHGSSTYQSKDGVLPTIIALDALEMPYLGNRVAPTFYDLKKLNLAYGCPDLAAEGCPPSPYGCFNDGYLLSTCECACNPQYTGTYCDMANPDYVPRCIQRFTIDDGLTGTIFSPNYPSNYAPDTICQYIITGPAESYISVQFTDFNLQPGNTACTNDYLDIFLADTDLANTTSCGSVAPSAVASFSNEIRIVFKSDSTIQDKGFSLMYTIHIKPMPMAMASCNVSFNSSVGEITNYVSESPINTHCTYEINVPEGQRVALTMHSFDVENGYCSVNSIEVYLGDGTSTPIQFCNQCVPKEEIISATNTMKIIFAVQGSQENASFSATYRAVEIAINSSNPDVEGSTNRYCQSTTDQDKGYIQSPRYPRAYRTRMCCQYEITTLPGLHVELNFARIFQIEEEDTISIDIGGSQPIRLILTGYDAPIGSYVSHAEKMSIWFESNEKNRFADRGFRGFFRSVSLNIPQDEDPVTPPPPPP